MARTDCLTALKVAGTLPGAWTGRDALSPVGATTLTSTDPSTGAPLATVAQATPAELERVLVAAQAAFEVFRTWPAPKRGEAIRRVGLALRLHKQALGELISLEVGKILQEGLGEVQEAIDIADFAVGLSRQLYGKAMHSERPGHRMLEQWHPLGPIGVVTAFNFPVAVWAWNAMIALACGDVCVWKPSDKAPLCALATHQIVADVLAEMGAPEGVCSVVIGPVRAIAGPLVADRRLPLISATGSCEMGRTVGEVVAKRLGRVLLELGGNNAVVVLDDADLDLVTPAVLFGAVGTAGQRCTSTRRLLVQRGVAATLTERLVRAYGQVRLGDPLADGTLMGPLIDAASWERMEAALARAREQGGEVLVGGERVTLDGALSGGTFVTPAIVRAHAAMAVVAQETFAPILYVLEVADLDEAIALNNAVPQGLSSAVFTRDLQAAERFLAAAGSDCGIANVNIGTSGAEIGGAFGGEKDTGGGREAGSDSWKAYMRRQTCTINYSSELPLAQGIKFEL